MTHLVKHMARTRTRGPGRAIAAMAAALQAVLLDSLDRLVRWQELAVQRYTLLQLDDRMLKDIGLSRPEALREARRPFWDDPLDSAREPSETNTGPQRSVCYE
ncbi:MAG: DUF1127 domain-containing protein [Acidiferrobacterales bacterium]